MATNITGTLNILQACRRFGVRKLVHTSTSETYGTALFVPITEELYLHADVESEMRRRLVKKLRGGAGATVAEIRDTLGTTRKFAVPLCEYLDRIGLTRREGDWRYLVEGSAENSRT